MLSHAVGCCCHRSPAATTLGSTTGLHHEPSRHEAVELFLRQGSRVLTLLPLLAKRPGSAAPTDRAWDGYRERRSVHSQPCTSGDVVLIVERLGELLILVG